jgi:hypothetical protein
MIWSWPSVGHDQRGDLVAGRRSAVGDERAPVLGHERAPALVAGRRAEASAGAPVVRHGRRRRRGATTYGERQENEPAHSYTVAQARAVAS